MGILIAEDMLLLLLDDDKGTVRGTSPIQTVLGGAVLAELALHDHVVVSEKSRVWKSCKIRPGTAPPPDDPVLREALATVAEKERTADALVERLGKGLKDRFAARLVENGILEKREGKVLGLFPSTRWPAADATREQELRRTLTAALVHGLSPDPRTSTLIALLSAIDRPHKVVDRGDTSSRDVRKRAKEIAQGDWAAKAVKDAIEASVAAVVAVSVAVAVGTTGT